MSLDSALKKTLLVLTGIAMLLVAADVAGIVSSHLFGRRPLGIFDVDQGGNAPSYYFAVLMLILAGILGAIGAVKKGAGEKDQLHWAGLAVVALCFSIDEAVGLHGRMAESIGGALRIPVAVWTYAWVSPYIVVMIVLVVIYYRFFFSLSRRIRYLFGLAFVTYVAGAAGAESLGGYSARLFSMNSIAYELITACEWTLEVTGVLVAVYAAVSYIDTELGGFQLRAGSLD